MFSVGFVHQLVGPCGYDGMGQLVRSLEFDFFFLNYSGFETLFRAAFTKFDFTILLPAGGFNYISELDMLLVIFHMNSLKRRYGDRLRGYLSDYFHF